MRTTKESGLDRRRVNRWNRKIARLRKVRGYKLSIAWMMANDPLIAYLAQVRR